MLESRVIVDRVKRVHLIPAYFIPELFHDLIVERDAVQHIMFGEKMFAVNWQSPSGYDADVVLPSQCSEYLLCFIHL